MSLLENLEIKEGSTHYRKRVGRGKGSGLGQTAGKGHKGQKARSGGQLMPGFEGGQMPLIRRIPKFGFKSPNRTVYSIVNLSRLTDFSGDVTPETLVAAGIAKSGSLVKILANGEVRKALNVKAHKFSVAAKEAIEKAGGKVEVIQA